MTRDTHAGFLPNLCVAGPWSKHRQMFSFKNRPPFEQSHFHHQWGFLRIWSIFKPDPSSRKFPRGIGLVLGSENGGPLVKLDRPTPRTPRALPRSRGPSWGFQGVGNGRYFPMTTENGPVTRELGAHGESRGSWLKFCVEPARWYSFRGANVNEVFFYGWKYKQRMVNCKHACHFTPAWFLMLFIIITRASVFAVESDSWQLFFDNCSSKGKLTMLCVRWSLNRVSLLSETLWLEGWIDSML